MFVLIEKLKPTVIDNYNTFTQSIDKVDNILCLSKLTKRTEVFSRVFDMWRKLAQNAHGDECVKTALKNKRFKQQLIACININIFI